MEKECKRNHEKMEIIFYCVGKKTKKPHRGGSYKNTVISAIVAIWCSLQQRGVNKSIWNPPETAPASTSLPYSDSTVSTETSTRVLAVHAHQHNSGTKVRALEFPFTRQKRVYTTETPDKESHSKLARIFGCDSSDTQRRSGGTAPPKGLPSSLLPKLQVMKNLKLHLDKSINMKCK